MDSNSNAFIDLEIPQGRLKGLISQSREDKKYYAFYGIPYAKKAERFKPPERWESWEGVLNATTAKNRQRSVQINSITKKVYGDEDCLLLNVFTPTTAPKKPMPVMVFIYGGGFYLGGGDLYGGKYLVDRDVVLVTFNYRLGALGFLNSGNGQIKGNIGMKDQVMCLKWIQENICHFGGDKTQVLIFGESAGAACVHYHQMSQMSSGLFQKAIMQSGVSLSPWAFTKNPVALMKALVKQIEPTFPTEDIEGMVDFLRTADARAIMAQHADFEDGKEVPLIYFCPSVESGPVDSNTFLADSPLNLIRKGPLVNEVPLIIGCNSQEALYRTMPFLLDPHKTQQLNNNWKEVATERMCLPKDMKNKDEVLESIRKYYMGDKVFSVENRQGFVNMVSDRMFYHSVQVAAIYHGCFHSEEHPVYLYWFDYSGQYSYLMSFGIMENYGTCHGDELQFLMDQKIFVSKITNGSKDDKIIGKLTEMWANFAKTGVPQPSWESMPLERSTERRPLQYYRIAEQDSFINDPLESRMAFWDQFAYEDLIL